MRPNTLRRARLRGATFAEYAILLLAIILVAAGTFKLVGREARTSAQRTVAVFEGGAGGPAGGAGGVFGPGGVGGAVASALGGGGGLGQMIKDFAGGAILGGFYKSDSGAAAVGSFLGGFLPFADARDIGAALIGVAKGEEGAGRELLLSSVGLFPVAGDAAKAILRNADEAAALGKKSDELAAGIVKKADDKIPLGEGSFSRAYKQGDNVIKEIKDTVRSNAYDNSLVKLTDAGRKQLAETQAEFHNELADAMPNIVPRVEVIGDGVLQQKYVDGLKLSDLQNSNADAAIRAGDQIREAVGKANKEFGLDIDGTGRLENGWEVQVDSNPANFRFDKDGNITSWFDPVAVYPKPGSPGTVPFN